jgi:hypothetical protein
MNIDEAQQKFGLHLRHLDVISAAVAGYTIKEMVDYFQLHELAVRHCLISSCERFGVPCDRLDVSTRRKLARFAIDHELPLRNIPARGKGKP